MGSVYESNLSSRKITGTQAVTKSHHKRAHHVPVLNAENSAGIF